MGDNVSKATGRYLGAHFVSGWLLVALIPATLVHPTAARDSPTLAWPPQAPRVRLEKVFQPRRGRLMRVLRKIAGEPRERGSVFVRPYGVAWDGSDLLITDPGAGRVLRIQPEKGKVRTSYEGDLRSPIGVAACEQGVVVTDSRTGNVLLLDSDLRLRHLLAQGLERPTGVVCHGGEVFVAETGAHRIVGLGAGGARRILGRRGDGPGELNFPTSLTLDDGGLWVGDTLNFRLQRLDPVTGEAQASFGRLGDAPGELPRLKGLAVDPHGRLWVADAHLNQVALYRRDGTFLMGLGRLGTGPGEFSFPAGIAAHPDGRVVVVDSLNRRLQLFRSVSGEEDER